MTRTQLHPLAAFRPCEGIQDNGLRDEQNSNRSCSRGSHFPCLAHLTRHEARSSLEQLLMSCKEELVSYCVREGFISSNTRCSDVRNKRPLS